MDYFCDESDHVFLKIMEGLWNLELEKSLSVQDLKSGCGNSEDMLRAVQMMEVWLAKFRRGFKSPLKTLSGLIMKL